MTLSQCVQMAPAVEVVRLAGAHFNGPERPFYVESTTAVLDAAMRAGLCVHAQLALPPRPLGLDLRPR